MMSQHQEQRERIDAWRHTPLSAREKRRVGDANKMVPPTCYVVTVSRRINRCHFLPRKPGVIAYAGEQVVCIATEMNILRMCFLISNCV
jgi:hypothetical protein